MEIEHEARDTPRRCPGCGGDRVAPVLYGFPVMDEDLTTRVERGEIVLGGCSVTGRDPAWRCVDCGVSIHPIGPNPPVTPHAGSTGGWEPWQREYVFGALLLFPPEPLRSLVNELRAQYDPRSQAICDAHVSLTVPFPRPPSESDWDRLRDAASTVEPFRLEYGPIGNFLPHPGVFLEVGPFDSLDRLRRALEETPPFAGAAPRRWPFRPHMTIAEFVSEERARELTEELREDAPTGSYLCDRVAWAVPDEQFRFTGRRTLQLGSRAPQDRT